MAGYLLAALIILQMGGMQYMQSVRTPATMPSVPASWNIFHAFGLIVSAGFWVLFVAGFIFAQWWLPLVGLFGGMALHQALPGAVSQPGLVYLATLAAIPFVVLAIQGM